MGLSVGHTTLKNDGLSLCVDQRKEGQTDLEIMPLVSFPWLVGTCRRATVMVTLHDQVVVIRPSQGKTTLNKMIFGCSNSQVCLSHSLFCLHGGTPLWTGFSPFTAPESLPSPSVNLLLLFSCPSHPTFSTLLNTKVPQGSLGNPSLTISTPLPQNKI